MSKKLKCLVGSNGEWKISKVKKTLKEYNRDIEFGHQLSQVINKRQDFIKLLVFNQLKSIDNNQKSNLVSQNNSSFFSLQSTSLSVSIIKQFHLSNQSSDYKLILKDITSIDQNQAKINFINIFLKIYLKQKQDILRITFNQIKTHETLRYRLMKMVPFFQKIEICFIQQQRNSFFQALKKKVQQKQNILNAIEINMNLFNQKKEQTYKIFLKKLFQINIIVKLENKLVQQIRQSKLEFFIQLRKKLRPNVQKLIIPEKNLFKMIESEFLSRSQIKQEEEIKIEEKKVDVPEIQISKIENNVIVEQEPKYKVRQLSLLSVPVIQKLRPISPNTNEKIMEIKTQARNTVKLEKNIQNIGKSIGEEVLIQRSMSFKFDKFFQKRKSISVDQFQVEEKEKARIDLQESGLLNQIHMSRNSKWKVCQNLPVALAFNKNSENQKQEEPKILNIFEESFKLKKKAYKFPVALQKAKSMPVFTPRSMKKSTILFSAFNQRIKLDKINKLTKEKEFLKEEKMRKVSLELQLKNLEQEQKNEFRDLIICFLSGYIGVFLLLLFSQITILDSIIV